mgnify:CR=1 FL=1
MIFSNPSFKGLIINKDYNGLTRPLFPIVRSFSLANEESVFFSFGQDWMHRGYLFPAFTLPTTHENEYAEAVRISVFDERTTPELTDWTEWSICTECGRNQPKLELENFPKKFLRKIFTKTFHQKITSKHSSKNLCNKMWQKMALKNGGIFYKNFLQKKSSKKWL